MRRAATQRALRIYGSQSWWGQEPRWTPPESPFKSSGFPSEDHRLCVHMGGVPEEIVRQIHNRGALGCAILDRTIEGREVSLPEAIKAWRRHEPTLSFDSEEFYVTIIVDRDIELDEDPEWTVPEFWWSQEEGQEFDSSFRAEAPAILDAAASHLASVIGPRYFETKVTDRDIFFLLGVDRPLSFVPVFSGSAEGAVGRPADAFPAAELTQQLASLSARAATQHIWLRTPIARYASTLGEGDPWRAFQALWLALETLSRKVAKQHGPEVLGELGELENCSEAVVELEKVDWATPGSPLAADFTILAILLCRDEVEADRATFGTIKKARDRLSHGSGFEDVDVSVAELRSLVDKYFRRALSRFVVAASHDRSDLSS